MQGGINHDYFSNPAILDQKSIEEIYRDMDGSTAELGIEQPELHSHLEAWVVIPPVYYEGVFLKGLLASDSMDLLLHLKPEARDLFVTMAFPRWAGHPWSIQADVVQCGYDNPQRMNWFYEAYPHRSHQILVPYEHEIDSMNEYDVAPSWAYFERDIDVLVVSRLSVQKNVPLLVEAALLYAKTYNRPDFNMVIITGHPFDDTEEHRIEYEKIQALLLGSNVTVKLIPHVPHGKELFDYYSHSKLFALGSLLEGKCRALREALYCNTPVVCFEAFNQYARGEDKPFPDGAGLMVPEFTAQSVAETWFKVHQNQESFYPRKTMLKNNGRLQYVSRLISEIPYFIENLPELNFETPEETLWLDLAVQANYQMSFYDYVYKGRGDYSHAISPEKVLFMLSVYFEQFKSYGLPVYAVR